MTIWTLSPGRKTFCKTLRAPSSNAHVHRLHDLQMSFWKLAQRRMLFKMIWVYIVMWTFLYISTYTYYIYIKFSWSLSRQIKNLVWKLACITDISVTAGIWVAKHTCAIFSCHIPDDIAWRDMYRPISLCLWNCMKWNCTWTLTYENTCTSLFTFPWFNLHHIIRELDFFSRKRFFCR